MNNTTNTYATSSVNETYNPSLIGVFISDFASPFMKDGVTITVYTYIFVIGLIFNAVVCLVISCRKSMHTTTGCYILNLSISDLVLVIVGAPDEAYDKIFHFSNVSIEEDGDIGCFYRTWAAETSASVSTMIVTAFTIERYLAICHPFVAHVMSNVSRVIKLIVVIWVIALLSSLPLARQADFVYYYLEEGVRTGSCFYNVSISPYPIIDISTISFFIVPMTIITLMHILIGIKLLDAARMRRTGRQMRIHAPDSANSTNKALKLLVAIVVAFFLCWAPVRMQRWIYIHFLQLHDDKYWYFSLLPFYARIFCLLSSIINPVIYSIMSEKFREAFMDLFVASVCRKKLCKHKVYSNTTTSGNGHSSHCRSTLTSVEL